MAVPPSYGGSAPLRSMPVPYQANTAAPIAEGLGAVGQAGEQLIEKQREKQQLEQGAQFSIDLSQAAQDYEAHRAEQLTSGTLAPGAKGYADSAGKWWDDRRDQIFANVTNPVVRLQAMRQWAATAGSQKAEAIAYGTGQSIALAQNNHKVAAEIADNTARVGASQGNDPIAMLAAGTTQVDGQVEMLPGDPAKRALIARELKGNRAASIITGLMERDPVAARKLLDSNEFNAVLDPRAAETLVRQSDVAVHMRELEIEKQARAQAEKAKVAADAAYDNADHGVDTNPNILIAEAERTRATDPVRAQKFERMAWGVNATLAYRQADPAQTMGAAAQIEAKKGWQSDPKLVAAHEALIKLAGTQRDAKPVYEDLDFSDPGAGAQRHAQAHAWAATHNGQIYILSDDQATRMGTLATGGPAQRAELAGMLSRLPGTDAITAAQQVAKNDWALQQAIDLPPVLQTQLFQGEELRKKGGVQLPDGDIRTRWTDRGAAAMRQLPVSQQNAVLQGAINVYAFRAHQKGLAKDDFDSELWDQSVNDVIDPSGRGGIGTWRGSSIIGGGAPLILPKGMPQREFDARLYGAPLTGAFYADKTPISKDELLSRFTPVPIDRDGIYRWVDRSGHYAHGKNGGFAEIDVRRLPIPRPVAHPAPGMQGARNAYEALPLAPVDPNDPYVMAGRGGAAH